MRDFMERRITSPTWDLAPPCKQALRIYSETFIGNGDWTFQFFLPFTLNMSIMSSFVISSISYSSFCFLIVSAESLRTPEHIPLNRPFE